MEPNSISRREMIRLFALASAAGSWEARAAESPIHPAPKEIAHVQPQLQMGHEQIAILVYPEFTALDALGPHYALAGMMGATVRFVAKSMEPVPAEGSKLGGFCVKPHMTFKECPEDLDLLLMPGGLTGTMAAIEDKATREFIASRGKGARLVASVCTGSLLLGAAGLLKGRNATSHWQTLSLLKEVGATAVAKRIVFDGKDRVTAAGVSAGLDLGFELVRRYRGDFYAKGIQLLGEYDPQPPFPKGGDPRTADKLVVDMLNTMHEPLIEKFRSTILGVKPKVGW